MTREEAIKQLKDNRVLCINTETEPFAIAYDLAIEALEQQPCVIMKNLSDEELKHFAEEMKKVRVQVLQQEPCEDCVSRAELKKWLDMNFSFGGALRKLELFERLDKELPSVTPTRKKGKWVCKFHGFPPEPSTVCSICGFDRDFNCRNFEKINYCPNCGAEMESEE